MGKSEEQRAQVAGFTLALGENKQSPEDMHRQRAGSTLKAGTSRKFEFLRFP